MRKTKEITIIDDEAELKFRLTQVSAVTLQKWCIKAGVLLAKSGLLDLDLSDPENMDLGKVLSAISKSGFKFLGELDPDKANALIWELAEKTAVRIVGNSLQPVTEKESENIFSTLTALTTFEKEIFTINFSFFGGGGQSAIPTSQRATADISELQTLTIRGRKS